AATTLNQQGYIDVTFNDPSGHGLNESTILDDNQEFQLLVNGVPAAGIVLNGKPTKVSGTTYRYTFTGQFSQTGDVTVSFLPQSFANNDGLANFAENETFVLATTNGSGQLVAPGPTAFISNPGSGGAVAASGLNTRQYIDITFDARSTSAIDPTSIDG